MLTAAAIFGRLFIAAVAVVVVGPFSIAISRFDRAAALFPFFLVDLPSLPSFASFGCAAPFELERAPPVIIGFGYRLLVGKSILGDRAEKETCRLSGNLFF